MLSSVSPLAVTDKERKRRGETGRQTERLREDRRGKIKERADGGHEEDESERRRTGREGVERIREGRLRNMWGRKAEMTKKKKRKRGGEKAGEREE